MPIIRIAVTVAAEKRAQKHGGKVVNDEMKENETGKETVSNEVRKAQNHNFVIFPCQLRT